MKALFRIAICGLLILAMVGIAAAYTENFQNGGTSIPTTGGGTVANAIIQAQYDGQMVMRTGGGTVYDNGYVRNANPVTTNEWSFTVIYYARNVAGGSLTASLMDTTSHSLGDFTLQGDSAPGYIYTRYYITRSGTNASLYVNGAYSGSTTLSSTANALYLRLATSNAQAWVDDLVMGGSDTDVVGLPPHTWFVGKDLITPSVKGLFDASYNNVNTTAFFYSTGNATSAGRYTYGITNPPTSGYITITQGAASDSIRCQAVVVSGTSIAWDKAQYNVNDVGGLTYYVADTYWLPSTYQYQIAISRYNTTTGSFTYLKNTTIASQTGSASYTFPSTAGAYLAEIDATPLAGGSSLAIAWSDIAYTYNLVTINGTKYDASTGLPLPGVAVDVYAAGTWYNTTTDASGNYNLTGLPVGATAQIYESKSGYTPTQNPNNWTPINPGTQNLTPDPIYNQTTPHTGTSVGGVVQDSVYCTGIAGVTVNIGNGTYSATTTTNSAGYYQFDNLYNNTYYETNCSKSGYSQYSTFYPVTTGAENSITFVTMYLIPGYTLIVNCRDAVSSAIITSPESTVTLSTGASSTTTSGVATFSGLAYGLISASAVCSGYYPSGSYDVAMTSSKSVDVYLYPLTTPTSSESNLSGNISVNNQGYGQQYPPHNVRFSVQTLFGTPISDVNVTAVGYETTAGSFQWLYDIFGFQNNETPIANSTLTGSTDHLGQINYMMFEAVKYHMTFNKSGYINVTWDFYPKDEYYTVIPQALGNATWYQGGYNVQEVIIPNVTAWKTNGTVTISYHDLINSTYNGTIWLNQTNRTNVTYPDITLYNFTVPNATLTNSSNWTWVWTPVNYEGQSYVIRYVMNSSTFTSPLHRDYGIHFMPKQINPMGLSDFQLMLLSCFFLISLACMFGAVQAPQGGIVVCIVGWLFYGFGWMNAMGATAPIALTLATVLAIAWLVMVRSRKGTWF